MERERKAGKGRQFYRIFNTAEAEALLHGVSSNGGERNLLTLSFQEVEPRKEEGERRRS